MADCIEKILKSIPDANKEEVTKIVNDLTGIRREAFVDGASNADSVYRQKAMDHLNGYRRGIIKDQIRAIHSMKAFVRAKEKMANPVWQETVDAPGVNKLTGTYETGSGYGMAAILKGSNTKDVVGSRLSVQASIQENEASLGRLFLNNIQPEDIDILQSKALDADIMEETFQFAKKDGKPGITGSEQAKRIGLALHKVNQARRAMLNRAGAMVDEYEGYVVKNATDSKIATDKGYDTWKKSIYENFDVERSLNEGLVPIKDVDAFLKDIYDSVTNNKPDDAFFYDSSNVLKTVGNPSYLAKRLEKKRTLHPKSGRNQHAYLMEFGDGSLSNHILKSIQSTSKNAGLIGEFGPDPKATFERLIKSEPNQTKIKLMDLYQQLDGTGNEPARAFVARAEGWAAAANNLSSLALGFASQLSDLSTRFANLVFTNKTGVMSAVDNVVFGTMKGFKKSEQLKIARLNGIGSQAFLGKISDRFGAGDHTPGIAARANELTFKVNFMGAVMKAEETAHGAALSLHLADELSNGLSASGLEANLKRYNIGNPEWELGQLSVASYDGEKHFDLNILDALPDETVKAIMQRHGLLNNELSAGAQRSQIANFRAETSKKFGAFYNEELSVALSKPGAGERSVWYKADNKNTVWGAVTRSISQYKMFLTAFSQRTLDDQMLGPGGRTWAQSVFTGKSNYGALTTMILSHMALTYVSDSFKKVVKNEEPLPWEDPETWVKMAAKGSMGFAGDFILGDFDSKHGKAAIASLAGPTIGKIDSTFDLITKLKSTDVEASKKGKETLNYLYKNSPFNGHILTQMAIEYMVIDQLQEALNPGYISRNRARMQKEGRSFMLDPNR